MGLDLAIGFDLGGTKTEAVAITASGHEVARLRERTPAAEGAVAIIRTLVRLRDAVLAQSLAHLGNGAVDAVHIGLGTPGSISPVTGLLRNSNTLCLNGLDLVAEVSQAMGQSVVVENDANCFALAEALRGAGRGFDLVFGVILGTGCGGGIVIKRRLHTGRNRLAGEWGHIALDPKGPLCWCGQRGCLETLVSGGALQQAFFDQTAVQQTAQEILSDTKHPVARDLQDRFYKSLGQALANLAALLDPDVVVLGGGVSNLPGLCDRLKAEVESRVFGREWCPNIVAHALGDSAGVLGAAWLALGARNASS